MTRAAPESKRFPAHFFAANQDLRQERARRIKSMIRLGPVCCSALADARTFADRKVFFRRRMSAEKTDPLRRAAARRELRRRANAFRRIFHL